MTRKSALNLGTSESILLEAYARGFVSLDTNVNVVEKSKESMGSPSPATEDQIGRFRPPDASRHITADLNLMGKFKNNRKHVPCFVEAGPRKALSFNPSSVKAAILTAGGIAPGLNSVIHAIVQRHCKVYKLNENEGGELFGIRNGFKGLNSDQVDCMKLTAKTTDGWSALGGTELGAVRDYGDKNKGKMGDDAIRQLLADKQAESLRNLNIDILYVLGGDGSMRAAHDLAPRLPRTAIAGVPKTMDNDILWVWESFGFATAVEEAARVINTLHQEAKSTGRICLVELFGAESGFVAANATLASAQVDLVLVPEVFRHLIEESKKPNPEYASDAWRLYMEKCIKHIKDKLDERRDNPHAVVVVAEGVSKILDKENLRIVDCGKKTKDSRNPTVCDQLKRHLEAVCQNQRGEKLEVFINQPRHNIRAVPPNAHDQIYCERLGSMAVDSALAGYTDFMVSQWMTEYVLVPLEMVTKGQKSIYLNGVFWKQVMNVTGQPTHEQFKQPR